MAGPSTNSTFRQGSYANTTGVDTVIQQASIELLTADPGAPELLATNPRVWINTTSGVMKFCVNGTTVKTITAT